MFCDLDALLANLGQRKAIFPRVSQLLPYVPQVAGLLQRNFVGRSQHPVGAERDLEQTE